jgi:hypothetical protein
MQFPPFRLEQALTNLASEPSPNWSRWNTSNNHAYPHKSGMMLCDVFVMQEEQHG